MKTDTRPDPFHDIHSRRTLTPKTKVVTSHPNTKFTDVKQITKNPRHHEQNMTKQNSRTQRRGKEHKRLKPGKNTNSQRTIKEQMLNRLHWGWTKAGCRKIGCVKDPMRNFPGQINDRTIQIEEKELTPSLGPTESTKKRVKQELHLQTKATNKQT